MPIPKPMRLLVLVLVLVLVPVLVLACACASPTIGRCWLMLYSVRLRSRGESRCISHVACCMLHVACCVLRVGYCVVPPLPFFAKLLESEG
jgi:hypothetical protein